MSACLHVTNKICKKNFFHPSSNARRQKIAARGHGMLATVWNNLACNNV